MEFSQLLKDRRSIRDYTDEVPSLELINEIIQDTCLAPTASNGQPCSFIIIRDRDFIKALSDESKKNLLAAIESDPNSPLKIYQETLRDPGFNVFYNAPCLVVFVGPRRLHSLDVDCALTVAYFMFSAVSRGLGTCWVALGGNIRDKELLGRMSLREDQRIVAPIILGYPVEIPPASERHPPEILKVI